MATPQQLATKGFLLDLAEALEAHELPIRQLFAFPGFNDWYNDELPKIRPWKGASGRMDPTGQVDDLLRRFLMGKPFDADWKSHWLDPQDKGVWELKTADVRAFGWFWRPDFYILYRAVDANWIKKNRGAYNGLRNETEFHRNRIELDEPKYTEGGYEDVFQI